MLIIIALFITKTTSLTSMAQLVGCHTTKWNSIPSQGTRLGCGPGPWLEGVRRATDLCFSHTSMFLSLSFPFLPLSLKINKSIKSLNKENYMHIQQWINDFTLMVWNTTLTVNVVDPDGLIGRDVPNMELKKNLKHAQ